MNPLTLARWQFGITTVYHFLFVPLTIGLSLLVALMQTAWYRTGKPHYLRMTKFWGKLFLINFAIGVVTGIVQEFQFGMNWSDYSRFVGDVFGAPLAMEALLAFFLESTFLGLWIFGWDKLPKRVHLATIWIASIGTMISAYFILAANSFMQHPVGYTIDVAKNRAELTSIWAVLGNSTTLVTFPHTIFASILTGGVFVVAISAWYLRKHVDVDVYRPSMRLALVATVLAGVGLAGSGDIEGKIMTEQQPMKMAAAEALYHTSKPAPFSLFTVGSLNGHSEVFSIKIPRALSFLATGSFDGQVKGIDDLNAQYGQQYGPGDYRPMIAVTYWSFRLMIGFGMLATAIALLGLWLMRRGRTPRRRFYTLALWALPLPFLANSLGWIFTEMGRQPWLVFGRLKTESGVSPSVTGGEVLASLIIFTLLYGVLAVIDVFLMMRYARSGPPLESDADEPEPVFAY
ncbi:MAG TPA: cytochrome ubiquinol oxidase subunit I [Acidothermaceae bacterium]|nr:cytochrome ubiquinol oxidase subunit I [Acidothermaceae bacterium]